MKRRDLLKAAGLLGLGGTVLPKQAAPEEIKITVPVDRCPTCDEIIHDDDQEFRCDVCERRFHRDCAQVHNVLERRPVGGDQMSIESDIPPDDGYWPVSMPCCTISLEAEMEYEDVQLRMCKRCHNLRW